VVRSALAWKLLIIWLSYAALIAGTTYGLHQIGLRYDDSTKDAVVWSVIAGLPLLFRFDAVHKEPSLMRDTLVGLVRTTALVEFFVNLYVFPLWVELLLQPLVALIAVTATMAGADEETQPAKKLLHGISAVGGLVILFVVARHLLQHHEEIEAWPTLLSFTQPVILSVVVLCFTYAVALVSSYELAFFRIGWSPADAGGGGQSWPFWSRCTSVYTRSTTSRARSRDAWSTHRPGAALASSCVPTGPAPCHHSRRTPRGTSRPWTRWAWPLQCSCPRGVPGSP
jgi:hypothetical protein